MNFDLFKEPSNTAMGFVLVILIALSSGFMLITEQKKHENQLDEMNKRMALLEKQVQKMEIVLDVKGADGDEITYLKEKVEKNESGFRNLWLKVNTINTRLNQQGN